MRPYSPTSFILSFISSDDVRVSGWRWGGGASPTLGCARPSIVMAMIGVGLEVYNSKLSYEFDFDM